MIGATGFHDIGGKHISNNIIDTVDHPLSYWEKSIHALLVCLSRRSPSLMTTDELRRSVENLEENAYKTWSYYDKWAAAMATILLERQIINQTELDIELNGNEEVQEPPILFKIDDVVYVKAEDTRCRWRKPHLRVPGYIFGSKGIIKSYIGSFDDPYKLAFRSKGQKQHLYSVQFKLRDIWKSYESDSDGNDDSITLDVYQSWLDTKPTSNNIEISTTQYNHDHHNEHHHNDHNHDHHNEHHNDHNHDHDHNHAHDHDHKSRDDIELNAITDEVQPGPGYIIGNCIIRILERKGILQSGELHSTVTSLEKMSSSLLGAKLVAKAWVDPTFKELLLSNSAKAGAQLGIVTSNPNAPTVLIVVENTDKIHNLCVCTLCSCYPSSLLGLSPSWYKSISYRSRAVREPRKLLQEFGTIISKDITIIVHDSTADTRYMVLPQRPVDSEGKTEGELEILVTRDSLIGVKR